jgi:hypothetical protein
MRTGRIRLWRDKYTQMVGTLLKNICVHLRVSAVASSWLGELKTGKEGGEP